MPNHIHRVNEIFFILENKLSLFFENELSVIGLRALPRLAWFSEEVLLVDNATCLLNKFFEAQSRKLCFGCDQGCAR